jgi:hypothetical protein
VVQYSYDEKQTEEANMVWHVRCRVSGGVTGTREALLKEDGDVWETQDFDRAVKRAADLNREMNGNLYRTAIFEYWPEEG